MIAKECRVNIHILCYGRREYTERCIESIYRNTSFPFELVIVDNNFPYPDGTMEYLKQLEKEKREIRLIINELNRGIAYSVYQTFRISEADLYIKIDNDIEIQTKGWLEMLLQAYEALGELAPKCVLGGTITGGSTKLSALKVEHISPNITIEWLARIAGALRAIPKTVIDRIGYVTPTLPLHSHEDGRFSIKLLQYGYQIGRIRELIGLNIDTTAGQIKKYPRWKDLSHGFAYKYRYDPIIHNYSEIESIE